MLGLLHSRAQGLNGAEIFVNGSGSAHWINKWDTRYNLIRSATDKNGGVYLCAFVN